jgi:hypothetical protein
MGKKNRKKNRKIRPRVLNSTQIAKMWQEGKLRPGPIRHEALSPALEERAKQLYARVGYMIWPTFEQWELGFLRDLNPESEIAVWEVIADVFDAYKAGNPDADKDTLGTLKGPYANSHWPWVGPSPTCTNTPTWPRLGPTSGSSTSSSCRRTSTVGPCRGLV